MNVAENNGSSSTKRPFKSAIDAGEATGKIATKTPKLFEDYWLQGKNWWLSGNILFVHGGYPQEKDRAWLDMDVHTAASKEDSPVWWRFESLKKMYTSPSLLDDKPVFVVNGHTPVEQSLTIRPYGINLDQGYQRKVALELRPAIDGKPAQMRFFATDCDEISTYRAPVVTKDYFWKDKYDGVF